MGKFGRYKDRPLSRGSASIEGEDLDKILDELWKNYDLIKQCGVTEIILTVALAYTDQCNWEFSQDQLRLMADMKIPLSVTCYERNNEAV